VIEPREVSEGSDTAAIREDANVDNLVAVPLTALFVAPL